MQPLQVAALALPVADREINEVQLRDAAEVGDRKNGGKNRLQARIIALVRELVHLQEPLVRATLHFDQVGNLGCGWNFGKIEPAANRALLVGHASLLRLVMPAMPLGNDGPAPESREAAKLSLLFRITRHDGL